MLWTTTIVLRFRPLIGVNFYKLYRDDTKIKKINIIVSFRPLIGVNFYKRVLAADCPLRSSRFRPLIGVNFYKLLEKLHFTATSSLFPSPYRG